MLKLIKPTKEYEQKAKEYIEELHKYNSAIHGTGFLDKYLKEENYDSWLDSIEKIRLQEEPGKVKASTYFLVEENQNKIVGMVNIRHTLNEKLYYHGGNIGYSISPTQRGKGYGKINLYLALEKCHELNLKKVLITANDQNIPSCKTIEALGGILENKVEDEEELFRRYWIDVEVSLKTYKEKYLVNS